MSKLQEKIRSGTFVVTTEFDGSHWEQNAWDLAALESN